MDKRSWPWRKKSSEKILASNDSAESSPVHSTRHPDDHQAVMKVLADHTRLLSADEGTIQWQQSDEKVKQLNERLAIALLDASAKDELVKQHAKVAEEAVSGWEKAEAEAATLKQQLDSAIQQKLATEDRVSHLDGALKECMRQLRHVREEQEEKIHDATVKNTREWERVRSELEEKLVDMEQKYLERDAENKAISKLLEERAITISEIGEAHSRAEADLNVLQIRFESMAKERAALKYECTVLKKKLEIRNNEERDLSKRSTKSANRQLLEAARKVEGECQLRGLVHKKPPGPGQMKSESESPGNRIDSNRRRIGKGTGFLSEKPGDAGLNMSQEETSSVVKDVDVLLERLSAMEEETRRLKELLARRDSELQHARFMCARTASKLSSVEEQLESLPHAQGVTKTAGMSSLDKHVEAARSFTVSCEPSLASVSDDGNDDRADSWASALIAELAHFKKGKVAALHVPKIQPDNLKETEPPISLEHDGGAEKVSLHTLKEGGILIEQSLVQKDAELHAAHRLCDQVRTKLASAEKELATLQSQNAVTQLSLQSMQAQLNVIFRAQDNGGNLEIVLDQARAAMGIPQHGSLLEEEASSPATDVDFKSFAVGGPDLTSAICKLVEIMKDLVTNSCEFPVLPHMESGHDSIDTLIHKHTHNVPGLQWKNSELDAKIKAFIAASNLFLHGKADIVQFVGDLSSVLSNLVRAGPLRKDASSPHMTRKSFHWDKMSLAIGEAEELSDANSPISDTSNVDGSEKQSTKTVPHDENSIINITKELPLQEVTRIQEELRKVQAEKVALETHMRVEFQRFGGIEQELAQLTGNKLELENKLQVANKELDYLKTKLHRAEQAESNLRAELLSAKSSRQLMDEQLSSINASRAESESQLKVIVVDRSRLQDRLGVLEREILGKQEKNAELEAKCWELKEQLLRNSDSTCSKCGAVNIKGEQASKEQEIAANLAECQQTILILGKQLKSLTSSKGQMKAPYEQSADQPVSPGNSSSRQSPSGLHPEESGEISSLLEAHLETSVHKKSRRHQRGKKELIWEPRRDSSASDNLDSELVSLSKSGRPLLELFGDKTPAHEHYIQAVEQLPSSSEEETTSSKRMEPVLPPKRVVSSSSKPPLHRKKKSPRLFTGVDMSRSMDDATSDKHNSSFTRLFFSRAKRTHS